jgi:hypothetical protein
LAFIGKSVFGRFSVVFRSIGVPGKAKRLTRR